MTFSRPIRDLQAYLEFPVLSHCNHFADMWLDFYYCPQFLLIGSGTENLLKVVMNREDDFYLLTRHPLHRACSRTMWPRRCLNLWLRILERISACILIYPVRISKYFFLPLWARNVFWIKIADSLIFRNRLLWYQPRIHLCRTRIFLVRTRSLSCSR